MKGSISGVTTGAPVYFTYGDATTSAVVSAGTMTADGAFTANIEGLTAGWNYYVRAWAQVGDTVVTGVQIDFRTPFPGDNPSPYPTLWADLNPAGPTKWYDTKAVIGVRLRNVTQPVKYGVYISDSSHNLFTAPPVMGGTASADGTYSVTAEGLTKGKTYWFQCSAFLGDNRIGVQGGVFSFEAIEDINPHPETDYMEVLAGQPRVIDVLANDKDFTGTAVTIIEVSAPKHGTAVLTEDQKILYTPGDDFHVEPTESFNPEIPRDEFYYVVQNERGGAVGAQVRVRDAANLPGGATSSSQGLLSANPQQRAGLLKVTLTGRGRFTASYQEHGATLPISAAFQYSGSTGAYTRQVKTGPLKGLQLVLNHNLESGEVNATADDGTGAVSVELRKVKRYSAKAPYAGAGRYAVTLVADTSATLPAPQSKATVMVNKTGSASITGKLNDGRPFSASANVSAFADGAAGLALYSSAYHSSAGYLSGPLLFKTGGSVDGTLDWQKPAKMAPPMNRLPGFQTTITATGSVR